MLGGHLAPLSGCLITPPFKWWERGGKKKGETEGERERERREEKKEGGEGAREEGWMVRERKGGKGRETERARRRQALIELVIFKGTPPHPSRIPPPTSIVCCRTRMGRKKGRSSHRFQKVSLPFWQMWCQLCCLIKRKWRWWLQHRRDLIW